MRFFEKMRIEWIVNRRAPFNRKHIMEKFGVSTPQASNDISKVLELYPDLWQYNAKKKQYERKEK